MAICVECLFYDNNLVFSKCGNLDLPISDFVHGVRSCQTLNAKGECKGFKPKPEPKSIYDLPSDEVLAQGGKPNATN